jgi:hypothetical protein
MLVARIGALSHARLKWRTKTHKDTDNFVTVAHIQSG